MSGWGLISWGRGAWGKATGVAAPVVQPQNEANLGAYIKVAQREEADLPADLSPAHVKALIATVFGVGPFDLSASTTAIPPQDLPASTVPIPSVDLGAFGGAHPPAELKAQLSAVAPLDLPTYITGGFSGVEDLSATLNQAGFFEGIGAHLKAAQQASLDLEAAIRVIAQATKDLAAALQPFNEKDLTASILSQTTFDTRAIITGVSRENIVDLGALIRRVDSDVVDLPVQPLKAVVSTHTSDKLPNLDKVSRRFFENRYVFGTKTAGLAFLTLEPIFGIFPDLHAEINAIQFFRENMSAFIRVAARDTVDITAAFTSVSPFINIRRLLVDLIPLLNLSSEVIQVGAISPIRGSITPRHSSSTGTAEDAGFITTASSYRFYLGTSGGLLIPPQVVPEIRITTYRNNFERPDLHATISGWHETDIGASISDFPFKSLTASLTSLDFSTISHLSATIGTFNLVDLGASLAPFGSFEHLAGQITTQGAIDDFPATLVSIISPLSFSVVSVSTMPSRDLGAIINYDALVKCSPTSMVSSLSAFIKPLVSGTPDTVVNLSADLNVLRIQLDLPATIVARRRTRIRTVGLTFTAKTRASEGVRASITPVAPVSYDITGQIIGQLHEVDLPASISIVRYEPHDVDFTPTETVANLKTGETKQLLVSFRSQVSTYIYDEVASAVYATDRGTWAIDLRTLLRDDSFFDRSPLNRAVLLSKGFQEFYSLDEAIRNAIVLLCERRKYDISASIAPSGAVLDLAVQLGIISADRMGNIGAKLAAVENSPDITASINTMSQFSGFIVAAATVTPLVQTIDNIGANIEGSIVQDLGAEIQSI